MTQISFAAHFSRQAKSCGLPVVLLHGSTMGPQSWTGLREHIGPRLSCHAPDLAAAPKGPRAIETFDGFTHQIAQSVAAGGQPVHLVGHDFGAVLSLKIAAAFPGQVASLTLIEPTAFNALDPDCPTSHHLTRDVNTTVAAMRACLAQGYGDAAMMMYTNLVNGSGAWQRTSGRHRAELTRHREQTLSELAAIAADRMSASDLAGVVCPTLLINGADTNARLRHVARALQRAVPFLQSETIAGAGHFPHLSDPHLTDPLIADFLVRVDGTWQDAEIPLRQAA